MKAISYLFPLAALLCFVEVSLPDATAQQTEELRKKFQSIKAEAEKGDAVAQFKLGWMYDTGQGVEKDYAEVVKWYRKAADQGHAGAQHELGDMYYASKGVEKDSVEAVKWYRKAAEQGYAKAQNILGVMYRQGQRGGECIGHAVARLGQC